MNDGHMVDDAHRLEPTMVGSTLNWPIDTAELLTICLGADTPGPAESREIRRLLAHYGGLRALLSCCRRTDALETALNAQQRLRLCALAQLLERQWAETVCRGRSLTSPGEAMDYLKSRLRDRRREVFSCLFLDTRHRVIVCEDLFLGSIDGACVYPRVVAEKSLRYGAAALIVAHNHPSGIAEPSLADQAITRRLKASLALLDIRLLDHFVIGDGVTVSLASRGML